MFDDDNRIAALRKSSEDRDELVDIREMQAGRGFIENIDRPPGAPARELGRELDALSLAAGELRRRLPELYISQSDIVECLYLGPDRRHVFEECQRLLDRHIEDIVNTLSLVLHFQRLAVVPLSVADFARDIDIREEMHFDLNDAVAAAGLAAAALNVKTETSLLVAAGLGIRCPRKQIADHVKDTGVRRRIRARCAPDRRLIDVDDLVELVHSVDAVVCARYRAGVIELPGKCLVENFVHERALARPGHARDDRHDAQREAHIDVLQVIDRGAADREPAGRLPSLLRNFDFQRSRQVFSGERLRILHDFFRCAGRHDFAAVRSGAGADINDIVRRAHRVLIVLDDNHRVPEIAESLQRIEQLVVVSLMKTDARLIENIADADKAGSDLGCKPDALCLAAGQSSRRAGEREIVKTDIYEETDAVSDFLQNLLTDDLLCR